MMVQADILLPDSSEKFNVSYEWRPINSMPETVGMVIFFRGGLSDLAPENFDGIRDERYDLGWWDGHKFRDLGTGHDTLESFDSYDATPTHWLPLPSIPDPGN